MSVEFVSPADLANPSDYLFLDCTAGGDQARAQFEQNHPKGAVFLDLDNFRDKESPYAHMMPKEQQYLDHLKSLGVGDSKPIVCYE